MALLEFYNGSSVDFVGKEAYYRYGANLYGSKIKDTDSIEYFFKDNLKKGALNQDFIRGSNNYVLFTA